MLLLGRFLRELVRLAVLLSEDGLPERALVKCWSTLLAVLES